MYQIFDGQQTSTAKLTAFFQKFYKTVGAVRLNEIKITLGNAFNVALFVFGVDNESEYDEGTLFWVSLQSLALSFNLYPAKDAYIRFSGQA